MLRVTFSVVALGVLLAAPVAAAALWLLLTDPVVAVAVAERESLLPLVRTLVVAIGETLAALVAYL
jgi:hypothetical protein